MQALAFQAVLVPYSPLAGTSKSPVIRTIAVRDDQTLEQLHEALRLGELGLRKGKSIAYVFDFGDEWRLLLKVVDRWLAGDESYPMLVEAEGVPPPQYPELDENE